MSKRPTLKLSDEPGEPKLNVTLMVVTPAQAARWLENNHGNRNLRDGVVAKLAGAIERGEWQVNGDTIRIDQDGNLVDGQHRLSAIVKAGIAVETLVAFNVPREAMVTMDTGVRRTLGDLLKFRGEKNSNVLGAALRTLWLFEKNELRPNRLYDPTNEQLLELLEKRPSIREAIAESVAAARRYRSSTAVAAVACYLFRQLDKELSNEFFMMLRTGVGFDSVHHPVRKLGVWLDQTGSGNKNVTYSQRYTLAMYVKAWNAFVTGREIKVMRLRSGEEYPTPIDPNVGDLDDSESVAS